METANRVQRTSLRLVPGSCPSPLALTVREFLLDRQARNTSAGTLRFYRQKLYHFLAFLTTEGVTHPADLTAGHVRRYLVSLQEEGRTLGGQHAHFRAIRAYLRFLVREGDLEGNPLDRLQGPRVPEALLAPVPLEHVRAMLKTCNLRTSLGCRDASLLLALLDTGCRAGEFLALNVGDVDLTTGAVLVRKSKGKRPRTVFLGSKALRALLRYLRHRPDVGPGDPLWATQDGRRLTYWGLRQVVRRRAELAGVAAPSLHSFRRAFALLSLRAGMDVYSLQRLMGHADLTVLRRYLAQTQEDLQRAHERCGPVDNLL